METISNELSKITISKSITGKVINNLMSSLVHNVIQPILFNIIITLDKKILAGIKVNKAIRT